MLKKLNWFSSSKDEISIVESKKSVAVRLQHCIDKIVDIYKLYGGVNKITSKPVTLECSVVALDIVGTISGSYKDCTPSRITVTAGGEITIRFKNLKDAMIWVYEDGSFTITPSNDHYKARAFNRDEIKVAIRTLGDVFGAT